MSSLAAVAGGAASVQYFQWRQGRGGWEQFHGSVIGHEGDPGRTFREVRTLSQLLARLDAPPSLGSPTAVVQSSRVPRAAILLDTPSRWMIDQASGPRNDGRRDAVGTAIRHFSALHAAGLDVDVVPWQTLASTDALHRFSLIVLPMAAYIPVELATRLDAFVQDGGTLVVTYFSGVFDHWQRLAEGGCPSGVSQLCGVRVTERDQLIAGESVPLAWHSPFLPSRPRGESAQGASDYCDIIDCADDVEVLARYDGDYYAGTPAITRRQLGAGNACYLACRLGPDLLTGLYRSLQHTGGTPSPVRELVDRLPAGVHWMVRSIADNRPWVFLFNPGDAHCRLELPEDLGRELVGTPILAHADWSAPGVVDLHPWGTWACRLADDLA